MPSYWCPKCDRWNIGNPRREALGDAGDKLSGYYGFVYHCLHCGEVTWRVIRGRMSILERQKPETV